MQNISNDYKNELEQKTSIKSKSKIVVDNVEYTSIIKTTPKLSHKNSTMFGGFSIKTCSFEIHDINGNLDFKDKEVTVYKGIEINGVMEYVKQGIFIPRAEQITTNVSQKTISFSNMQDKGQLFDDKYESSLDWANNQTHTGLEIVQEICRKLGTELESTNFNWSTYDFKQPNFNETITYREVISRLAEIGGAIAYINCNGKLVIRNQYKTNHTILNNRYVKLNKEQQFGPINVLTLGKKDINDDISHPKTKPSNIIEWKIYDNPFVDLYREEMVEQVASYIIGNSIIPFELIDFVDGFCYELNDVIKVLDRSGNSFDAVILNYETTSRIRSKISAGVQEKTTTNYNLAGSSKKEINKVKFEVDHINKKVNSLVMQVDGYDEKISKIEQTSNEITSTVSTLNKTILGEETYELTEDTTYQTDKEYYILNDNNEYFLLIEGTDYNIGDSISTSVYEKTTSSGLIQELGDEIDNLSNITDEKMGEIRESIETINSTMMKQTSDAFEMLFTQTGIEDTVNKIDEILKDNTNDINTISQYIHFEAGTITLGASDSQSKLIIQKDRISFMTGDSESAYISQNQLYITDSTILRKLQVGRWITQEDDYGNLNTKWVGGNI